MRALAVIVLVLLGTDAVAAPRPDRFCMDPEMREKVREILLEGIEAALKRHVQRVFNTWMKDPSQQPARAKEGMKHGIAAYVGSRQAAQGWDPPRCGEE